VQLTFGGGAKSNPSWSPNGLNIAYQLSSSGPGNQGSDVSLWVIRSDGANPREITSAGAYDADACWSPVTNQMAFASNRTGTTFIWLANDISTPTSPVTWGAVKDRYRK
jgi:Tol biopolymer transport system component